MFSINNKNKINSRRKMLFAFFVGLIFAVVSIFPSSAFGALNKQINYQGKLTDTDNLAVPNASYNMEFKLYTSLGALVWTETRTGGNRVPVSNGLFSVMLGEVSSIDSIDFNQTLYLGVNIGGSDATPIWDGEMLPRKILGVVPAALEAEHAINADVSTNIAGGNSTTELGSIPYQSNTDTTSFVSPNLSTTKKFLRMTGTGASGAVPAWDTLVNEDIPSALSGKTYEGLTLVSNPTGFSISGGTTSKTLTINNSLTLEGTDGATLDIGNGGTLGTAAFMDASSIPDVSNLVPYTGATQPINLNDKSISNIATLQTNDPVTIGENTTYDPINIVPSAKGTNAFTGTLTTADLTASRGWTLPDTSGILALLSDIPSTVNFVPYTGATQPINLNDKSISNIATLQTNDPVTIGENTTYDPLMIVPSAKGTNAFTGTLTTADLTGSRGWTLPDTSGILALLSDIPSTVNFVPYTGATQTVNLNDKPLSNIATLQTNDPVTIGENTTYDPLMIVPSAKGTNAFTGTLTTADLTGNQSWTLPNKTGTIAMTSDIVGQTYPGAGIAVSTGSAWGTSIPDNSTNWNTAYTYRLSGASGSGPLTLSLNSNNLTGSITQASSSSDGYLSSTDWTTFNSKLGAESDTLATVTGRGATTTIPSSFTGGATIRNLALDTANSSHDLLNIQANASGTNRYTGTLTTADLTGNQSWTLPNKTGTIAMTSDIVGQTYPGAGIAVSTGSAWGTSINNSAGLAGAIADETGTGSVVFSASPTLTGTLNAAIGTFSGALTSTTLNTGQGANELYAMNQNVRTTDATTFAGISATPTTAAYDILNIQPGSLGSTRYTGTLTTADLTAERSWILPNVSGTIWTSGNDGAGSGLDADTLDGHDTSYFQIALTNPVTGTGTTHYLSKWTGANTQGNSIIYDDGSKIGIGTPSPSQALHVAGNARITGAIYDSTNSAGTSGHFLQTTGSGTLWAPAVPYTGATTTVNLGAQALSTTGTITAGQIIDFGLTSGYLPYVSVSKQLIDSSLYTDGSAFGIGTTSLSGTKFKVSLDNISASDSYSNEDKIASSSGTVVSGGSLQLYYDGVCGSYTVTGQDGLTYGTVQGADGNCWLDRNLGATQVATSSTDSSSYGDLYQWGRLKDGHQVITSGTTATLSTTDDPGHDDFILDGNTSPYDWRSPQNNNLWQGVSGTNNVCPAGFRLPTQAEWSTLVSAENITNSASAFSSSLKLPVAGYRNHSSGGVYYRGSYGYYWSSSVTSGVYAYNLDFSASAVNPANYYYRAGGFSVRCVKD